MVPYLALVIINDSNRIEEVSKIPEDKDFTFENGYYSRVTSIFVDIRDSTTLKDKIEMLRNYLN